MRIIRGFPRQPGRGRVVTLGVFDGIHRGHAHIFKTLRCCADAAGLPAVVVTFDEHPQGTLAPDQRPPRLATDSQRLARMRALGVDEVVLAHFTHRLAATPADVFVRRILVGRLGMRHLVVGQDFVFGRDAGGDVRVLRVLGKELGFRVTVVKPLKDNGRIVSSTAVRKLVAKGEMARANRWLGWPYVLHGRVVHGAGRGTGIGVPTANLLPVHEIIPAAGVYAVRVRLRERIWPALCHIGPRPTFCGSGPDTIEIHIPGWKAQLYGRNLDVQFLRRLRGIRTFADAETLKRKIRGDWERAQAAFRAAEEIEPA